MERTVDLELKQPSVFKSWRELNSQWYDLQNHFDSTRKTLQTELESLSERENAVSFREEEVEARESRFEAEFSSKKDYLVRIERLIEDRGLYLESLESSIQEHREELDVKQRQLSSIRESIVEKDDEFDCLKNSVEWVQKEYLALKRRSKRKSKKAESKEKEVIAIRKTLRAYKDEIESQEDKLNTITSVIELKEERLKCVEREAEFREANFVSLKNSVDRCAEEFELKQREIQGFSNELEAEEKSIELKIEEAYLIFNRVNTCLKEVEARENNVESLRKSLERVNELESRQKSTEVRPADNTDQCHHPRVKVEPLKQAHTNTSRTPITKEGLDMQYLLNLQLQEHDSVCNEAYNILRASSDPAKLVLEAMGGFYPWQSGGEGNEFDVRIVRRSCVLLLEKLMEVAPPINSQVKDEAVKLANDWISLSKLNETDYLEISGIIQLVNSYNLASEVNLNDFCRLLDSVGRHGESSQLRQVRSNADQSSAVPRIVKDLLADLTASFLNDPRSVVHVKISKFLKTSSNPASHVLDFIESFLSQNLQTGYLALGSKFMTHCVSLFEQLFKISPPIQPRVRDYAMKLAVEWNGKIQITSATSRDILGFLQFLHTYGLFSSYDNAKIVKMLEIISHHDDALRECNALSFADAIPGFIENLIQRKKNPVDAVGLIYAFNQTDKFSPVSLLMNYMKDTIESNKNNFKEKTVKEKVKATDEHVESLENVIKCVDDHAPRLSQIPVGKILSRIARLRQRKLALNLNHEIQNPMGKKRGRSAISHQAESDTRRTKVPQNALSDFPPGFGSHVEVPFDNPCDTVFPSSDAPR